MSNIQPTIRIGTAGWSIPKQFAPKFPAPGTHLERYARALNCCEINSSFYRPHQRKTWAKWAASVPENFRFSVKAPRTFTHESELACSPEQLSNFLTQVEPLADKLGPILFQLPPASAFNPSVAEAFFTMLRKLHSGPAVFEPRHPTWFTAEADRLLQRFNIARVAADPARVPEAAHPGGSNSLVYYRLHGPPRIYYSEYSEAYLCALANTIAAQHRAAEVWCLFDNTAAGAALGNARALANSLDATGHA